MKTIVDTMELYEVGEALLELKKNVVKKASYTIDKKQKVYNDIMKRVGDEPRYFAPIPIALPKVPNVEFLVMPSGNSAQKVRMETRVESGNKEFFRSF